MTPLPALLGELRELERSYRRLGNHNLRECAFLAGPDDLVVHARGDVQEGIASDLRLILSRYDAPKGEK